MSKFISDSIVVLLLCNFICISCSDKTIKVVDYDVPKEGGVFEFAEIPKSGQFQTNNCFIYTQGNKYEPDTPRVLVKENFDNYYQWNFSGDRDSIPKFPKGCIKGDWYDLNYNSESKKYVCYITRNKSGMPRMIRIEFNLADLHKRRGSSHIYQLWQNR